MFNLNYGSLFILLLSLLTAVLFNHKESINVFNPAFSSTTTSTQLRQKLLLLTAHPDDESMFFAPTLLGLRHFDAVEASEATKTPDVYSLCLSTGNADGLGGIRTKELEGSLDILGVQRENRWILDHVDLQDNITAHWDAQLIADVVRPYVIKNEITAILTFDKAGVSGHPNHKSLFEGAKILSKTSPTPRLYKLVSLPKPTKYASIFAPLMAKFDLYTVELMLFFEAQFSKVYNKYSDTPAVNLKRFIQEQTMPVFVSGFKEYSTAFSAMREHKSQMVWFRWLYVAFSRYMWVNEWVEVKEVSKVRV